MRLENRFPFSRWDPQVPADGIIMLSGAATGLLGYQKPVTTIRKTLWIECGR
jgi:hypothetical protein